MATLKDIWNYPNNPSRGYVTDAAHWSGDNSYGVDQRISEILDESYRDYTGSSTVANISSTELSQKIGEYINYFDAKGQDTNLTFRDITTVPLNEWSVYPTGYSASYLREYSVQDKVCLQIHSSTFSQGIQGNGISTELDYNTWNSTNAEPTQFFGWDWNGTGIPTRGLFGEASYFRDIRWLNQLSQPGYVGGTEYADTYTAAATINGHTAWTLYSDQAKTTPLVHPRLSTVVDTNFSFTESTQPASFNLYEGALMHFTGDNSVGFVDGDRIAIGTTMKGGYFNNGGGSYGGTVNQDANEHLFLKNTGYTNTYEVYTDSALTTAATLTNETKFSDKPTFEIQSDGTLVSLAVQLDSTQGWGTLINELNASIMSDIPGRTNRCGFCRIGMHQGANPSSGGPYKAVHTTLIGTTYDHEWYSWEWLPSGTGGTLMIYEDHPDPNNSNMVRVQQPAGQSDYTGATSGAVIGTIEIIDVWCADRYTAGSFYQPMAAGTSTSGPLTGTGELGAYQPQTNSWGLNSAFMGRKGYLYQGDNTDRTVIRWDKKHMSFVYAPADPTILGGTYANPNSTAWGRWMDGFKQYPHTYLHSSLGVQTSYQNAVIDWTKLWTPGSTTFSTPTFITAPISTGKIGVTGGTGWHNQCIGSGLSSWTTAIVGSGSASLHDGKGTMTLSDFGLTAGTDLQHGTPIGVFEVMAVPDSYVAPTPYAEDVFDTDSEWDDAGGDYTGTKLWPKHITPRSIKVIQATPGSVTTSQSGIKYVRTAGIVKHQLEVTYPPMNETAFREFEATVSAARGQATPFYFDFKGYGSSNVSLGFNRIDDNRHFVSTPLRYSPTKGDNYLTIEGFDANATDAILKGEYIIIGGARDGNLVQATSGDDANVFGEVKFRINQPARYNYAAGGNMYVNPAHAIVTLAEDTLEYNIGMDQLYTFTVRFDFDEWK